MAVALTAADMVCPGCGGPGRLDFDWRGDGYLVCDAYKPCNCDLASILNPHHGDLEQLVDEIGANLEHLADEAGKIVDDLAELSDREEKLRAELGGIAGERAQLERDLVANGAEQAEMRLDHAAYQATLNGALDARPVAYRPPVPARTVAA